MKKTYLFGAMLLGLFVTGCSSDDLMMPEGNQVSDKDQTFYVSVGIKGDTPNSRAASDNGSPAAGTTDFEDGTHEGEEGVPAENLINNAYFVFYDEDGNVVGDIIPVELDDSHLDTSTNGGELERVYKSVVPVSVKKGEKKPAQVICYINP
ncbi:MAG: hypothetical protein K2H98_07795, partial [Duncaniella sp.]|nr:hypothetical protein [Duncaniella sp.]